MLEGFILFFKIKDLVRAGVLLQSEMEAADCTHGDLKGIKQRSLYSPSLGLSTLFPP